MKFAPTENLTIDIQHIGASAEPVLIIDNFLADPYALIKNAAASDAWYDLPPGGYPGRRAPVPKEYARAVLSRLDAPVRRKLLPKGLKLSTFECAFSMVTKAPSALQSQQKLPHIDIARPNRVAILHYLCSPEFGGTAFFRQSKTELEQIAPADKTRYLKARADDLENLEQTAQYPSGETPGYVKTGQTDIRFNRLVAYRSFTLHSGIIQSPELLSVDPEQGRLTANFFVDYA